MPPERRTGMSLHIVRPPSYPAFLTIELSATAAAEFAKLDGSNVTRS
jgi:hypothetical protein